MAWLCLFVAIDAINPSAVFGQHPALTKVRPEERGMDSEGLAYVDNFVEECLQRGRMTGCVVFVARPEGIALLKAYGNRHGIDRKKSCLWQEN